MCHFFLQKPGIPQYNYMPTCKMTQVSYVTQNRVIQNNFKYCEEMKHAKDVYQLRHFCS